MKKFFSLLFLFAMLLSLSVPAFATDTTPELKVYAAKKSVAESWSTKLVLHPDTCATGGTKAVTQEFLTYKSAANIIEGVTYTWVSSNESVAKFVWTNEAGTAADLQTIGNGETTITVTGSNQTNKSFNVIVNADKVTVTYLTTENGETFSTAETYVYELGYSRVLEVPDAPTREGYAFDGWYYMSDKMYQLTEPVETKFDTNESFHGNITVYAKWTPTYTVGDDTYNTLNEALEQAEAQTEITVPEEVTLDDAGALTVPANSTITVESSASAGSGETAASVKELTITPSGSTPETVYLVTVGDTTSAVKGSDIGNEVVAKDSSGNTLSGDAAAAQLFDIPKVLASISSTANTAIADVDFAMKATDVGVTQKEGHNKTFEVHPYATDGTHEYEVPAEALIPTMNYSVTLDLDPDNAGIYAGMYARITHYTSDPTPDPLGTFPIGSGGIVTFTMDSFSPVGVDVIYPEDDATFTMTVDAPETIDAGVPFDVEVFLKSTINTNLSSYSVKPVIPAGFTLNSKTNTLNSAAADADGNLAWTSAVSDLALTAGEPHSLGKLNLTAAAETAQYNVEKTITLDAGAVLTFSGAAFKQYTPTIVSDSTKVTTTYAITWDYSGGKVGSDTSSTDNVGVNVVPTAPEPVKPGYILSWDETIVAATAATTYTAVWTLDTTGMSVQLNDYGYAYLNATDATDYDKLLVLKAPTPTDGYAYAIDGSLMFATTEANYRGIVEAAEGETVYVYLVNGTMTTDDILGTGAVTTPKLSVIEGTNTAIVRDGDLNRDGNAKQGDLGVLVDLFKNPGIYSRTGAVDVRARLEADIDNSETIERGFKSITDINALIKILFPTWNG